jgi:P27 family predicted phage terminase small subunit
MTHKAPSHLSQATRVWWSSIVSSYELEGHHLRLLQACCESWDRCEEARKILAKQGLTIAGSRGGLQAHPAVQIERDARTLFVRCLRELDLDSEPVPERSRPPALKSNRGRISLVK